MKWLIYLFSFLSINLIANQIAMKKLLAVTGEEIFSAEIWMAGDVYLNPFNYLTLYYKYHDAAPTVFQKFLPIIYIGFLLSLLAMVGLKLLLTEKKERHIGRRITTFGRKSFFFLRMEHMMELSVVHGIRE